jgi:hypothetical protein
MDHRRRLLLGGKPRTRPSDRGRQRRQDRLFIATGRLKHGEKGPEAPRGRIPAIATAKERMARKLKTKKGRGIYARRKAIIEPVFGQIYTRQGNHVLLRGLEQAARQWELIATCYNLLKLFKHRTNTRILTPAGA